MTFKNICVLCFGAILFIGWHFFIGLNWTKDASFDVVCGAIIEFYTFTYIISEHAKSEEKKRAHEMEKHLNKIEKLLQQVNEKEDGEKNVEDL